MRYYWFDTNCFSDLIEGIFPDSEKARIFSDVENKTGLIVISPYVFYEILKGRNNIVEIKGLYDKLISIPNLCLANYTNVFDTSFSLIDAKGTINHMKMNEILDGNPLEYAEYRDGYKKMLGIPYARYLTEYCKMASIIFMVCNECDGKGQITERTKAKVNRINVFNSIGKNQEIIEEFFSDFFISYNYKSFGEDKIRDKPLMQEQLLVFINSILSVVESRMELIEEGKRYDKAEFNLRVTENEKKNHVDLRLYHKVLDSVSKKTGRILSPKRVYEEYAKPFLNSLFFQIVFEQFVAKRVFFNDLNNDFIDAINIHCAGVFFKGNENYYYTGEQYWIKFLEKHCNDNLFEGNKLICRCGTTSSTQFIQGEPINTCNYR